MGANGNEWNGWQIPHTGVNEPDRALWHRDDPYTTIRRSLNMKMSNFGALWVGNRMSQDMDYTRTQLTYITKDDLSDWRQITEDPGLGHNSGLRSVTIEQNPYTWGSTVKRFRDDQFFRMGMEHYPYREGLEAYGEHYVADDPAFIERPHKDVMDQDERAAEGMVDEDGKYKNYPTEGYRSFGGKYDFLPYTGVLGRPRGNEGE